MVRPRVRRQGANLIRQGLLQHLAASPCDPTVRGDILSACGGRDLHAFIGAHREHLRFERSIRSRAPLHAQARRAAKQDRSERETQPG